ncbi:unnamed protein product [Porites lobata]|uniref:EGF-like domain-containing protein n=1 Tax=Porites lobata TaxID=104759 RepID=A0ABN8QY86_9CNID|nr:unnamed protein product [Porites lobata]
MTARIVFRITVVAVLVYSAVTQKCPARGRSESSIIGWMLRGHVYDTLLAELPFTCVFKCRQDNRCQSFNWVISLLTCEFNNRTKEARPEDFIPNPERSYYPRDLKRVPLGSIQELPAETCDEIKRSEGHAVSGKYWFSTVKSGTFVMAYCNMKTNGEFDIDECSVSPSVCDINANCSNTRGSYYCTCKAGYTGDGKTCQESVFFLINFFFLDTDECSASPSVCDINANCSNTRGSYYCTCKTGFTGDGKNCQDIDECSASPYVCDINANCSNTRGSYYCTCKPGFTGDGKYCQVPSECNSYIDLDEPGRYWGNNSGSVICDQRDPKFVNNKWYRFVGGAGRMMASYCIPKSSCSTHRSSWINGDHPTSLYTTVTTTVCMHWGSDCCERSYLVGITQCDGYYVYKLQKPTSCSERYCGVLDANDACFGTAGSDVCACNPGYRGSPCSGR